MNKKLNHKVDKQKFLDKCKNLKKPNLELLEKIEKRRKAINGIKLTWR
jgi:hypothetical protein